MRALIVSDIHSNLEALQSVISVAETNGGFHQIWLLGDLVGYGPDPGPCIDLIRQYDLRAVAGNHDLVATGKKSPEGFNPLALAAIWWTTLQLTSEHYSWLIDLPVKLVLGDITMDHGSPRAPLDEYLISPEAAAANFPLLDSPICLVGHSHIPFFCRPEGDSAVFQRISDDSAPLALGTDPMFINPGGLGQPRDQNPKAPYAIYDSEARTISHNRAQYDVATTQEKMRERGLPSFLSERLAHGL